jgi:hypothetical protein
MRPLIQLLTKVFRIICFYRCENFPLGELILDKDGCKPIGYFASTAEDLKGRDHSGRQSPVFITQYKPVKEYICLFVVASENEAGFIFVPY